MGKIAAYLDTTVEIFLHSRFVKQYDGHYGKPVDEGIVVMGHTEIVCQSQEDEEESHHFPQFKK